MSDETKLIEEADSDLDALVDVIEAGKGRCEVPHDVALAVEPRCPACSYDCMELPTLIENGGWFCQRRTHVYMVVAQDWLGAIVEVREERQRKRQETQERAEYAAAIRRAEAERDEARRQRCLVRASLEALANGARVVPCSGACDESKPCLACRGMQNLRDWVKDCEQAEAERDAQADLVGKLTRERDEARVQLRAANDFLRVVTLERDHAQQVEVPDAFWQRDEAQAQVWGLICVATNGQWRERDQTERTQRNLSFMGACLDEEQRKVAELTATRDLLTAENARLQKERDEDRAELEHSRGNVWALMCLFTNEDNMGRHLKAVIKDLRAQIATLELLRRGGK